MSPPPEGQLALQVNRLVQAMEVLSQQLPRIGANDSEADATNTQANVTPVPEDIALSTARRLLTMRRQREKAFGSEMFSDPVWDMLVELYVARAENSEMSVGNACIAAAVPLTSALRKCQELHDREMVRRYRDPRDKRRIFLRLSDDAFATLTNILAIQ